MKNKAKWVAFWGILSATAIAVSAVEGMFDLPFLPPGAKPGLSNIVTVISCIISPFGGGIYISVIKSLFALFTRGTTAFLLSFAGGICSSTVTSVLIKMKNCPFSFVGIGIIGATVHNGAQLFVAIILSGTTALMWYAPALLIFSVISGSITGIVVKTVKPYLNIKEKK